MNYLYTGEQELVFTSIQFEGHTLQAVPGETYDLDEPNDPRFVPSAGAAPAASSTAVEPPADSGGETPSSPPEPLDTEKDNI